jgi:hypothetical protein
MKVGMRLLQWLYSKLADRSDAIHCLTGVSIAVKGEAQLQGWKGGNEYGRNSAVRPGHEVYTQPVGQLLRGRTLEYGQGTLFIMRKGALRHTHRRRRECKRRSACYGLDMWVVMNADMRKFQSYIQYSRNQTIAKEWGVCEVCELKVQ